MDDKSLQREALGWYDLAERIKAELRVACFMLNQKQIGAEQGELDINDLECLDFRVIGILRDVVSSLGEYQSKTHLSDE